MNYSARGGMSVTTDTIGGQSRLLLARADPRDSGNYTCVPGPGATPASVTVHVLNGILLSIIYMLVILHFFSWKRKNGTV